SSNRTILAQGDSYMLSGTRGKTGSRMSLKFAWAFATVAFMGAADKRVSFSADIRPVFEGSCWKCHGGAIQLSKLDLRTRSGALKGGARGPAIIPGKADE